jgi:deazaflavin-dependent oxidoreductase (nitroreductase family)
MSARYADAGRFRRFVRRTAATRPGSWVLARVLPPLDRVVFRLTRRRATFAAWLSGLPVVMLWTTGARSGREIVTPLLGIPDADAIVVAASSLGGPHHPAWYHNLRAHPLARLAVDGVTRAVEAQEVEEPERERLIALVAEIYPGARAYIARAAPRRIPIIRLIPPGRS